MALYYAGQCPERDRPTVERLLVQFPAERRVLDALRGSDSEERPTSADVAHSFEALLTRVHAAERDSAERDGVSNDRVRVPRRGELNGRPAPWRRFPSMGSAGIAAGVATCIAALLAIAILRWPVVTAVPQSTVRTQTGERATLRLADGSSVVLGAQSTLRYPSHFGAKSRDLYLDGEAYFTVSHRSTHPFVVHTRHAATRVLGTAFLVKSYANDSVTDVMVTEGKVALRQPDAQSSSGTTLVYGDLAHIDDAGMITVAHDLPIERYVEWSRGHLVYRDTPLGEVIPDLEHWYGLTIVLRDPTLAKSRITLTLDVESVEQAIASLSRVSGLTCVRVGNTVTLSREQQ